MSTAPAPEPAPPVPAEVEPQRLHPLTPLFRGLGVALVVFFGILRDQITHPDFGFLGIAAGGVVVVGAGYGLGSWWFTRYRLTDDSLHIDTGLVMRRNRVLRYDRLQAVDVAQPLVPRIFGMAELRMDVAGGDKREGRLGYLRLPDAQALRARLLARAAGLHPDTPTAPERLLLAVPAGRILGATMSSSAVLGGLLAAVVYLAVTLKLGQPLAALAVVPWILGVVTPIVRNVTYLGQFELSASPDGLRIRRGLTSVEHQTLPPGRIQGLSIKQPLLWRTVGWFRVEVDVAGMSTKKKDGESAAVVVPVGTARDVATVTRHLFGTVDPFAVRRHPAPRQARWLRPIGARYCWWGLDDVVFVAAQGWLTRTISVVPHAKTQSVRAEQGPLQRLLGLADVIVDTPQGPVRAVAVHRDVAEAAAMVPAQVRRAHELAARATGDQWMRPAAPARPAGSAGPHADTGRRRGPSNSPQPPDIG